MAGRETPYELIDELMAVAGEEPARSLIKYNGQDPIFPTPMRIGDLGAATIGASAVQAARLWQMRTGFLPKRRRRMPACWWTPSISVGPAEAPPISPNTTAEGRQDNRRIELVKTP